MMSQEVRAGRPRAWEKFDMPDESTGVGFADEAAAAEIREDA
ncbi:hypothetical protein [Streptomyces sp. TRM70350]|nr:hypothetical protein [Streptomyces sp. TRM70350]